jgi:signal transduction histidine kinase
VRWFGTNTDVHDQRLAMQERERLYEAQHVLRREAETANRQKDEFLAVVSHELRSPLNAMLGWTQMLRDHLLPEEAVPTAVAKIESSGRMLSRLIEDLLDVSRIVGGKLEIERGPVDLTSAIVGAVERVRSEAAHKDLELVIDLEEGEALWMLGSQQRLEQIGTNLLTNAIKFSRPGGRIVVGAHRDDSELVFTVRDDGEGIPPHLLGQIFNRFRQADSSRRRRHGGLGLGLSIVRHLTELHGGSIVATSQGPGTGACFTVRLPAGLLRVHRCRSERQSCRRPFHWQGSRCSPSTTKKTHVM